MRTLISDLKHHINHEVTIKGWLVSTRDHGKMIFLVVRDESGQIAQVAHYKPSNEALGNALLHVNRESAMEVMGTVKETRQAKLGLEIVPTRISVVGPAAAPLPIEPKSILEDRLDWRYLDLRRPEMDLVFRLQTTIEHAMRSWWLERDYREMHSPKLTGHASESGAELFNVPYFGRNAYLAQSPQFYKQMAMAAGWGKVFEIGPVFRANPSHTVRHDTEFTSVDVELSWIESHHDVMREEEEWLNHVLTVVKDKHGREISERFGVEVQVPKLPFPKVSMSDALAILKEEHGHVPNRDGDLDPHGERLLAQWAQKHHNHEFIFVTDWPAHVRAFYHMLDEQGRSKSFDLIWKGTEVTTGAQREHRVNVLEEQAVKKGIKPEEIDFYLNFFRYGMPPHGGFGFGLSRMLMLLTGLGNVREVTYLYRGPNRLTP